MNRGGAALAVFGFIAVVVLLADFGLLPAALDAVHDLPGGDKTAHFLLMGMLSFAVNRHLLSRGKGLIGGLLTGSLLVGAVVTLEELSQVFLSHRSFSLADLGADYLGIFLFGRLALLKTVKDNR